MKKIVTVLILIVILSCRHEESTNTKSIINNTCSHSVIITPFYQGNVVKEDSVKINANQLVNILSKDNRGKGTGFSYPSYIAIYDSIQIIFDDVYTISHFSYKTSSIISNPNAIPYNSNRSIYNQNNYGRRILSESKHSISNEYTFTFVEQDYLNAQR